MFKFSILEKFALMEKFDMNSYPANVSNSTKRKIQRILLKFRPNMKIIFNKLLINGLEFLSYDEHTKITNIVNKAHIECGHGGKRKTYTYICQFYYGITRYDVDVLLNCDVCKSLKKQPITKTCESNQIYSLLERVVVDLIDFNKWSSINHHYSYIFTAIDHYSRYALAVPIINKSAESTKDAFIHILKIFRNPKSIVSDNGREFSNELINNYLSEREIPYLHGHPYTPRHQGVIERFNRTLKRIILSEMRSRNVPEGCWSVVLQESVEKYNIREHYSHGFSPGSLFLNFPIPHKFLGDIDFKEKMHEEARLKLQKYYSKMNNIEIVIG